MDIKVTAKPSFRDITGKFAKANAQIIELRREDMRAIGGRLVEELRNEAPTGKTGRFKRSIIYRTFTDGSNITLKTYSAEPLGKFIREGTQRHQIAANTKSALYFYWPKIGRFVCVPKAGGFNTHVSADNTLWIGKGFVDHPGTKPNNYAQRAFDKVRPEMQTRLRQVSVKYAALVTSGVG